MFSFQFKFFCFRKLLIVFIYRNRVNNQIGIIREIVRIVPVKILAPFFSSSFMILDSDISEPLTQHRAPKHPRNSRNTDTANTNKMNFLIFLYLNHSFYFNFLTRFMNLSFLSYSFLNIPNDAKAGLNNSILPFLEFFIANKSYF